MRYFSICVVTCIVILIYSVNLTYAFDATLAWDANSETDLAGYKVYYGTTAGGPYSGSGSSEGASPIVVPLSSLLNRSSPEFTVHGLADGTYYFVATAYNTGGLESGYSNEVSAQASIPFTVTEDASVIEAEVATIKTAGGPIQNGWCLWSNGTLGEDISIPETGTYEVVVRAYGSPLGGIWPLMALSVDGAAAETVTVDTDVYKDYSFQVDLTSGVHSIEVSFLNDAWYPGVEDRNLYIDRFVIISPP